MKETIVLITNHTPKEITVQGHVMPPLAKDLPLSVFNVNRFKHEVEAAYPNGLVSVRLEPTVLPEVQTKPDTATSDKGTALSALELSASVEKALINHGVTTVEQLTEMTKDNVIAVKGIAQAGLQEIVDQLAAQDLTLKETEDE
ncbi:DNA-directed RNA polymerase subunit alpha C-terminal domain-containing protein [Vibrio diabolicus]|uniref:DNA-directed RNA polymerase subunit alpha C-terminal domain-containing protein n=1 Tax=Vibrio diabolicus TaxID=50719 RepID=UPI00249474CF|nr:DNA-directed RNA polymerase subunit alpha C-terminal domain-containing protein [Vibrio diabolicus]MDG2676030.1 DNA-directed RNA polymerase subunit alpha C-terminal domain-containing protein [Vibrio parahaemolyticus]